MATSPFSLQSHEQYDLFELSQGTSLTHEVINKLGQRLLESQKKGKKILVSLPANCKIDPKKQSSFFNFLQRELKSQYLFIPQTGVSWSHTWCAIASRGLFATEKEKAFAWINGKVQEGKIASFSLADVRYLKCSGNFSETTNQTFVATLDKVLQGKIEGTKLETPACATLGSISTWLSVSKCIVIDIADVFLLAPSTIHCLQQVLQKNRLTPAHPGIYFVTSGPFQAWFLRESLGKPRLHQAGNVIRVMPKGSGGEQVEKEAEELFRLLDKENVSNYTLFLHRVDAEQAAAAIRNFSPDAIIAEEISDAARLREEVPDKKDKINHITPAADAGVKMLSPQMITRGYDLKLFAEYLTSCYRNLRGEPNDTYIYYLDAASKQLEMVVTFILAEFSHVFTQNHIEILEQITKCETHPTEQGNFIVSLLDERILRLGVVLPMTAQGGIQFLSYYAEIFPTHYQELCTSLKLYIKGVSKSIKNVKARLHIIEGYSQISIRQEFSLIEARLQAKQVKMTVKARPHNELETQFRTLFALINSSEIFDKLPDKEIFIDLISLLWENFEASLKTSKGFLITLKGSERKSKLEVFQSNNNKAILREQPDKDGINVHLSGNSLSHPNSQKRLLKMISALFQDGKEAADPSWKFACFEALSAIAKDLAPEQSFSYDLEIVGKRWSAVFISSSRNANVLSDNSRKTIENGADVVEISDDGQKIKLVKNPFREKEKEKKFTQMMQIQSQLEDLRESVILQKDELEKKQEAKAVNDRLRQGYEEALKAYNKKYGGSGGEDEDPYSAKPKTLEEALKVRQLKGNISQLEEQRKKIRNNLLTAVAIFFTLFIAISLYLFNTSKTMERSTLVLRDTASSEEAVPTPVASQPENVPVALTPDSAEQFVRAISIKLLNEQPPTQDELNSMLKKIYFELKHNEEFRKKSGDLHNLMARLFLYKIHLDQREERFFDKETLQEWRIHSQKSLSLAREAYQMNSNIKPSLKLAVKWWMPEQPLYEKAKVRVVSYQNIKEAIADLDLLKKVK